MRSAAAVDPGRLGTWAGRASADRCRRRSPVGRPFPIRALRMGTLQVRHTLQVRSSGRAIRERAIRERAIRARAIRERAIRERAIRGRAIRERAIRGRAIRGRATRSRDRSDLFAGPPSRGCTESSQRSHTSPTGPRIRSARCLGEGDPAMSEQTMHRLIVKMILPALVEALLHGWRPAEHSLPWPRGVETRSFARLPNRGPGYHWSWITPAVDRRPIWCCRRSGNVGRDRDTFALLRPRCRTRPVDAIAPRPDVR